MAIIKPPRNKKIDEINNFIDSAPDSSNAEVKKPSKKEKKIAMQIYVTPTLKNDIEQKATELGLTSSGFIGLSIVNYINSLE